MLLLDYFTMYLNEKVPMLQDGRVKCRPVQYWSVYLASSPPGHLARLVMVHLETTPHEILMQSRRPC